MPNPPAIDDPSAYYFDEEVDVVKVTVDRREKSLQDYAGAATAIMQEDLERSNITSVRNIDRLTPSVTIGTQEGNTEIYIRGVGSDYNTELGDPAVATHIDGVYIARPRGVGSMLFDLERLEVNRGPQGTLRGRNATAGTLNIVTAKPKFGEWVASGSVQLGNYAQRLTRAMVNVPLGDTLALRFATFSENREPFFENAGPIDTITPAESADVLAYRASARWQPFERLNVTLGHDRTQEKGTGYVGSNFRSALNAGLLPDEIPNPRAVVYRGPQPSQDMLHWGVNGEVTVDLGPMLIGYLGGYRDLAYQQTTGGNLGVAYPGMPAPTTDQLDDWSSSYWDATSKSIIQELRLYAPDDARVRWTVGGFYFREKQTTFLGSAVDQSTGYLGNEFNMPDVKSTAWAGFVDATVDIISSLRATGGVRVTTETKERHGIGHSYSLSGLEGQRVRFGTEGFRFAARDRSDYTVMGAPMAPYPDLRDGIASFGARDTLDGALQDPNVSLNDGFNEQHGKYEQTFVDFRLGLDYDLTPANLLYVTFGTGHHSGGFNDTIRLSQGAIAPTYKPEVLYATEVGSKNEFLDRRLITNLAAFWYAYKDQQFTRVQDYLDTEKENTSASSAVRFNAASSRILGLEADVTGRLPAGFSINLAATLLDARFVEGVVADTRLGWSPDEQLPTDLEGNRLPRAPLLSANYSLGQVIQSGVGYFDWLVSAQTRSEQYMTLFNGKGRDPSGNINPNLSDRVPSYTRIDASIGYMRPDGLMRIDLFGTNLTDTTFMTTLINTPSLNLRFFNPPRQFGARLTVTL